MLAHRTTATNTPNDAQNKLAYEARPAKGELPPRQARIEAILKRFSKTIAYLGR